MKERDFKSSLEQDRDTIEELAKKLVTANRILESEKLATPFGHISARIPDKDLFLISRSITPGLVTLNDILVCDMEGKIVCGEYDDTYSEVYIHSEVYKKRRDVKSVIHSHSPYVIALSMVEIPVIPANLVATVVCLEPVPLYKKMLYIDKPELGEEVATLLSDNRAVMLKGHGAVTVGDSIEEALFAARNLEFSAMLQWMARCLGPLGSISEEEKRELASYHRRTARPGHGGFREWTYYSSKVRDI